MSSINKKPAEVAAAPVAAPVPVPIKPSVGLSGGIRFCIAVLISICLGLFILMWDGGYIPHYGIPSWFGFVIFLPLLAVGLGYLGDCLTQHLSCGQVQWLLQLQRVAYAPILFLVIWILLYFFPTMRWPIEGLAQHTTPAVRRGLSSAFYAFWMGLYTQSYLVGLAQVCPV
jgi:hypothetical protein